MTSARRNNSKAEPDTDLEAELDKLALQIVKRATRADIEGLPIEPLPTQLQALKVAGSYFALKRKHAPTDDGEGSGWGNLLMGAVPLGPPDEDDDEDDDEDEDDSEDDEEEEEELIGG